MNILPHEYAALYSEWFNDYLTLSRFAEALSVHPKRAQRYINKGHILHNDRFGNT